MIKNAQRLAKSLANDSCITFAIVHWFYSLLHTFGILATLLLLLLWCYHQPATTTTGQLSIIKIRMSHYITTCIKHFCARYIVCVLLGPVLARPQWLDTFWPLPNRTIVCWALFAGQASLASVSGAAKPTTWNLQATGCEWDQIRVTGQHL